MKDMDQACIDAREYLRSRWSEIKELHPEYEDIGTPSYMTKDRICFGIKLCLGKKKSVQYARLLLELKLGRVLSFNETVDHIDFDSTNNDETNLQLLSRKENSSKGPTMESRIKVNKENANRMKGNILGLGSKNGMAKLTDEQVAEIKKLQESHFRGQDRILASQFNVSRELISQIRRNKVRV